jgi:hypothetical protein
MFPIELELEGSPLLFWFSLRGQRRCYDYWALGCFRHFFKHVFRVRLMLNQWIEIVSDEPNVFERAFNAEAMPFSKANI